MLVNGTSEQDWPQVARLCATHPDQLTPSFGLHPWNVPDRSENWLQTLREFLLQNRHAAIGECGLDRWKKPFDLSDQIDCLRAQIHLARELKRPLTIHCLKAWGPLLELLEDEPDLPPILLHAYSGSTEMVPTFTKLGAYFSFNGYFLHDRKGSVRETFRIIPTDRLLLETDAPSMLPPQEFISIPLPNKQNHPANQPLFLPPLARLLETPENELKEKLAANYQRFVGQPGKVAH